MTSRRGTGSHGKRKRGEARGMSLQPHFKGGEGAREESVARAQSTAHPPRHCRNSSSPCITRGQRVTRPPRHCLISDALSVARGVAAHPLCRRRISRIRKRAPAALLFSTSVAGALPLTKLMNAVIVIIAAVFFHNPVQGCVIKWVIFMSFGLIRVGAFIRDVINRQQMYHAAYVAAQAKLTTPSVLDFGIMHPVITHFMTEHGTEHRRWRWRKAMPPEPSFNIAGAKGEAAEEQKWDRRLLDAGDPVAIERMNDYTTGEVESV
ncbi:hypothetical protein ACLOJK_013353 [Asimina triloba]